jgi:hypothetical protein
VYFQISSGATLNDWGYNALVFGNNALQIYVAGEMDVKYGNGATNTLIDKGVYSNDYINVVGGTLSYLGSAGVTNTFTVPVWVQNGGTFSVSVGGDPSSGGKLVVIDGSNYMFPNNSKESVYMQDASSSVQLSFGYTLECDDDYYQAGGTLVTTDGSTCTLQDGSTGNGTANIVGDGLSIDSTGAGTGYGKLNVNATKLNFSGTLYVAIGTTQQGQSVNDLLNVTGTTNLQGAALHVTVNNAPPPQGSKWVIIQDGAGKNIENAGNLPITTNPQTNLNGDVDPKFPNQYDLSF